MPMRIALGADHAGVTLKDAIRRRLEARGVTVSDVGTATTESVDYPDFAARVAADVSAGTVDYGILVCGSGIGMAIAANRFRGVRAAPVNDVATARLSREHNNANVLALGERLTPPDVAFDIVDTFLETPFAGGRHERRVQKLDTLAGPTRS